MILWNTSQGKIESMVGGTPHVFAANEKKRIHDPAVYNHLIFKLEDEGLVLMPDEIADAKEIEKFEIIGLANRRKMLDGRIRNFNTMNKEREAAKLSPEPPNDHIIKTCEELEQIDARLNEVNKSKIELANKYLSSDKANAAKDKVDELTGGVVVGATKVAVKSGKGQRAATAGVVKK